MVLFHTLLIAFQISLDALFGIADGVRQFNFCEIVGVKTLNITLVRAGHGFLRLHNLQIIRDSGSEAVLRLCESLLCQIDRTARDFNLLGGGIQIEQRGADFVVNPAAKVAQLRARLLQLGIGFQNIGMHAVAGKNRNIEAAIHLPRAIRLAGRDADVPEICAEIERRIASGGGARRDSSAARTCAWPLDSPRAKYKRAADRFRGAAE